MQLFPKSKTSSGKAPFPKYFMMEGMNIKPVADFSPGCFTEFQSGNVGLMHPDFISKSHTQWQSNAHKT